MKKNRYVAKEYEPKKQRIKKKKKNKRETC